MTKEYVGMGMRQLVINAVGKQNFRDEIETHFRTIYNEHMMDNTCIMKGFDEVFKYLETTNVKSVILSNKNRSISDDMVKHFGIEKYFVGWYGGDSFGVKKPNPYGVSRIISEQGVTPEETIMIGDSSSDISAGAGAGAKTCFCTYGYGNLKNVTADFTADSPYDLVKILEALN
jgi:phosphoglycolate phosphatase